MQFFVFPRARCAGWFWLVIFIFALLQTGCTGLNTESTSASPAITIAAQPYVVEWMPLIDGIGQSFVPEYDGLSGIELFLTPLPDLTIDEGAQIVLHLRGGPGAEDDLATSAIPIAEITEPAYYRFAFAPQPDSRGRSYYAEWTVEAPNALLLARAPGEQYNGGALYINRLAQEAQMTFRLTHAPGRVALDLLQRLLVYAGILFLTVLLTMVPGLALLLWTESMRQEPLASHWTERAAVAAGVSLAIYPLLMLWAYGAGISLGRAVAWMPVLLGLAGLGWHLWLAVRQFERDRWLPVLYEPLRQRRWRSSETQASVTLLLVMGVVFGTRLLAVRNLVAPSWGDAVQHAAITQLMLDNGGLFQSWQPYAPYETLSVHFGFPALSAVFHWAKAPLLHLLGVTGLWNETPYSVLLAGQVVNSLAVLTVYPLAVRMAGGRRWAGVGAVLVAGLLSLTPGSYLNWGRYAQLTGQAILPVALWFLWRSAESAAADGETGWWRLTWTGLPTWSLAGITLTGAALGHYRMPLFYTLFALAWLLVWAIAEWRMGVGRWLRAALALGSTAAIAALAFLPWLLQIRSSRLAQLAGSTTSETVRLKWLLVDMQTWLVVQQYIPIYLVALAVLALGWAIWRRERTLLVAGVWIVLLPAYKAGQLLALPAAHMMESFATIISLYVPMSILLGWLLVEIWQSFKEQRTVWRRASWGLFLLLVSGGALWGMQQQIAMADEEFVMVTPPDRRAMAWIAEHTPGDATFLVEGYQIEGATTSIVGSDAGWWIPIYTQRANTVPPQYAILNERPAPLDYTQRMVDLVGNLAGADWAAPETTALLCQNDITHIFIGQRQGTVGFRLNQLFTPALLLANSSLETIYHQDRVYVFALRADTCQPSASPG